MLNNLDSYDLEEGIYWDVPHTPQIQTAIRLAEEAAAETQFDAWVDYVDEQQSNQEAIVARFKDKIDSEEAFLENKILEEARLSWNYTSNGYVLVISNKNIVYTGKDFDLATKLLEYLLYCWCNGYSYRQLASLGKEYVYSSSI